MGRGEAEARGWLEQDHPEVMNRAGSGRQQRHWGDDQAPNRKATGRAAFLGHESGREGACV